MTRSKTVSSLLAAFGLIAAAGLPVANADNSFSHVEFSTLITTPEVVEGLTGDSAGNLYTPGRNPGAGNPCPVYRVNVGAPALVVVGFIPAPSSGQCSPSGLTFNSAGSLFITNNDDTVYTLIPNSSSPPTGTPYAEGVPGNNGVTFDRDGNLWISDGTQNQGRVWRVAPGGGTCEPDFDGCVEAFRIQPTVNTVRIPVDVPDGVGREAHTLPPDRAQNLVANGLLFDRRGDLLVADTARGAIWRVKFDRHGNLRSTFNCDTTFVAGAKTLCLDNIMVAHPYLEGADGIVQDRSGNIWVSANERNAVLVVSKNGDKVAEVFRNPPNALGLRNGGPLESPTSPFVLGRTVCTANSDGNRRDNSPNGAGEIGGPGQDKGKISCASLKH